MAPWQIDIIIDLLRNFKNENEIRLLHARWHESLQRSESNYFIDLCTRFVNQLKNSTLVKPQNIYFPNLLPQAELLEKNVRENHQVDPDAFDLNMLYDALGGYVADCYEMAGAVTKAQILQNEASEYRTTFPRDNIKEKLAKCMSVNSPTISKTQREKNEKALLASFHKMKNTEWSVEEAMEMAKTILLPNSQTPKVEK